MHAKRIETYHSITNGEETDRFLSAVSEFNENGNEILAVTYSPDGEIEHKTEYKFNPKGLKIAEINYYDETEISDSHQFEYDELNRPLKQLTDFADGSQTIKTFERNEADKTLTVSSHDDQGELEEMEWVRLNHEGKVAERKTFDDEKKLKEHLVYTYDTAGNVINAKEFDEKGAILQETFQEFNVANEPVKRIVKNAKGDVIDYAVYLYDEQNRLTEVKFGNRYLIKHEYNAENNSHTEIRILGNGQIEEKVTYYYNAEGKTVREERLDSVLEYVYIY